MFEVLCTKHTYLHNDLLWSPLPAELTFLWTYLAVTVYGILLAISDGQPCVLISIVLERPVCLLLLQNLLLVYLVSQLISTSEHRKQVLCLT